MQYAVMKKAIENTLEKFKDELATVRREQNETRVKILAYQEIIEDLELILKKTESPQFAVSGLKKIIVNGSEFHTAADVLDYDAICRIAFEQEDTEYKYSGYTVTYSIKTGGSRGMAGSLSSGDVAHVCNGMIFNVADTSKA